MNNYVNYVNFCSKIDYREPSPMIITNISFRKMIIENRPR